MYEVIWDDDVHRDAASIWADASDRVGVLDAIQKIDHLLKQDPTAAGMELSEGQFGWINHRFGHCSQLMNRLNALRSIASVDCSRRTVRFTAIARVIYHFKNAKSRSAVQPVVIRRLGRL